MMKKTNFFREKAVGRAMKTPGHIRVDFKLFDFERTAEEMQEIQVLNEDKRYYTSATELLESYADVVKFWENTLIRL